jgi:hypothetical protein
MSNRDRLDKSLNKKNGPYQYTNEKEYPTDRKFMSPGINGGN